MNEIHVTAFIRAATWHGDLEEAELLLRNHPTLPDHAIFTAAILGQAGKINTFLSVDPSLVTAVAPPFNGNALTYLCLSKFLRLKPENEPQFLEAATILLDAGADPNAGFWTSGTFPEFETPLYGAAGVAHNAALTRLLLARGADPNDGEAAYHSPEDYDNAAMMALVETGKITAENLAIMLMRKNDWHDYKGVQYLLQHAANPNGDGKGNWCAFHHALKRDNHISIINLLLDYGANPYVENEGLTAAVRAVREGRGDVLEAISKRGTILNFSGVDQLIAAAARGDQASAESILEMEPNLQQPLQDMGGSLLAKFSGTGNANGVRVLLDLGLPVDLPFKEGDPYYSIPANSHAIHIAAWRGRDQVVELLLERGAAYDIPDANGRTPLLLAVLAGTESYWKDRRTTRSAAALLNAGADASGITIPTGYDEMDKLLLH